MTVNLPFQFTRPRGARPTAAFDYKPDGTFQFTRPRGARRRSRARCPSPVRFNSRAHGGRDSRSATPRYPSLFQFTRPRGARRLDRARSRSPAVSIHAPTGGATNRRPSPSKRRRVSIHAPTGGATISTPSRMAASAFQFTRPRGARLGPPTTSPALVRFNSRAHGGRDVVEDALLAAEEVSIHAPTGGATSVRAAPVSRTVFQFTRPRGARRTRRNPRRRPCGFNSRAHGGRDPARHGRGLLHSVSIHAPTGGATSSSHGQNPPRRFQFTRPRGARRRRVEKL